MAFINITRWPSVLVFALAGGSAALFAFVTFNLFSEAMANVDFLRMFGGEAIKHGALLQLMELILWGSLSLSCWLLFKISAQILEDRYLAWANKPRHNKNSARARNDS